jgi:diaminohydroxyphosphoribosylaminopyrimidine deaminase/5-amino-6-(5-phosphoribosylamino)uracil reductase
VRAGILKVFVAVKDPNPRVSGKGLAKLKRAGVEVQLGVGEKEARELHEHYLFAVKEARPFVTLKAAVSIDGRIATAAGHSQWITGEAARRSAHKLRAKHHAIAVGAETLLADDPALTVRMVKGEDPRVVVFDPRLRCGAKGLGRLRALRHGSLVLHAREARADRVARLRDLGIETVGVASQKQGGRALLRIDRALSALGKRDIRSLMVEGGGRLLGSFVAKGLFEELHVYDAPVILGEGRPVFAWAGPKRVDRAPRLERVSTQLLGDDRLTVYRRLR